MKLRYQSYDHPFVYPFRISGHTKTHQPSLVVELEHRGLTGYGEAPAISYYHIPVEKMIADIESKKMFIEKYALTDPERYWHYLHHLFPSNNFLVCALDMAAWDIYGKMRNQPLHKMWNYDHENAPITNYTIGIDEVSVMLKKIDENPWPLYKVKMGSPNDLDMITAIRNHTAQRIRIDANGGWSVEDALAIIPKLRQMDIELIEQPLAKEDWQGMKTLRAANFGVPLIADESCVVEDDVQRCAAIFDGINIKLTKCGGLTPARRMIKAAREAGLQVMIGSMNETAIGTAAGAHLAGAMDYVDLDGPLLLASERTAGISYNNARVVVSQKPGLGIDFDF